ncbi:MAG: NAD-dependent epimerase/dehydratase family protein [Bacteroidia bacterium]
MEFPELRNKKIAIVGMGYMGRNMLRFLGSFKETHNIDLYSFDRKNLTEIKRHTFDLVFNCAGNTGDFRKRPNETIESNLAVTKFLTEEANIREALILLSSTRIYGFTGDSGTIYDERSPVPVKDHLDPDFIYNGTKMLLESLARQLVRPYRIVTCRLSNVYGRYSADDLDDSTYLKVMLKHCVKKEKISLNQNVQSTKDYIFIDDAVDGILRAALYSKATDIYNIAAGESYSLENWLNFLGLEYGNIPGSIPNHSCISISAAKRELGFTPQHSLKNLNIKQIIHS